MRRGQDWSSFEYSCFNGNSYLIQFIISLLGVRTWERGCRCLSFPLGKTGAEEGLPSTRQRCSESCEVRASLQDQKRHVHMRNDDDADQEASKTRLPAGVLVT